MGNAGQANYSSGKAAVTGLTKTLAKEWGQFKINVNAVAFGWIETRLTASKDAENTMEIGGEKVQLGIPEQMRSMAPALIPLGRRGSRRRRPAACSSCARRGRTSSTARCSTSPAASSRGWRHQARQAFGFRARRPARRARRRRDLAGHGGCAQHLHGHFPGARGLAWAAALPRQLRERALHALGVDRDPLGRSARADAGGRDRRHALRAAARHAHGGERLRQLAGGVHRRPRLADRGLGRGALGGFAYVENPRGPSGWPRRRACGARRRSRPRRPVPARAWGSPRARRRTGRRR